MNSLKHGLGKFILKRGITYEGKFDAEKLIEGKMINFDGDIYEGTFDDKYMPDGDGVMIYTNQSKYVGQFKEGKRHGYGVLTY